MFTADDVTVHPLLDGLLTEAVYYKLARNPRAFCSALCQMLSRLGSAGEVLKLESVHMHYAGVIELFRTFIGSVGSIIAACISVSSGLHLMLSLPVSSLVFLCRSSWFRWLVFSWSLAFCSCDVSLLATVVVFVVLQVFLIEMFIMLAVSYNFGNLESTNCLRLNILGFLGLKTSFWQLYNCHDNESPHPHF